MVPLVWRRILRGARAVLGVGCLAAQAAGSGRSHPWYLALFGVYTIYAVAVLIWPDCEEKVPPAWTLAIDCLVLMAALWSGSPHFELAAIFLYVFVMSSAVILHDWWRPVVVAALCLVAVDFIQPAHSAVLFPFLIGAGVLGSALGLERHFLNERLSNASRQGVMYRHAAEQAREAERQRIAADFHDGPLQSFHSFQMRLEVIRKLMARDPTAALTELHQLQELGRNQVQELRAFIRSMAPSETDGSLNFLLHRMVDQFAKDTNIAATFSSNEFIEPEDPEVVLEVLQIVREALHNVQKHSGATRVAVGITAHDQHIEITVEDNGKGFVFSGNFDLDWLDGMGYGPGSVKRRVRGLGGELELDSSPGHGVTLKIRLSA